MLNAVHLIQKYAKYSPFNTKNMLETVPLIQKYATIQSLLSKKKMLKKVPFNLNTEPLLELLD